MKKWRGMLAALLAAMMLAGCGSTAVEVADTALSIAEEIAAEESTSASDAAATEEFTEAEIAATASSVDDGSDAMDPDFTIDASEELQTMDPGPKVTTDGEKEMSASDAMDPDSSAADTDPDKSGSVRNATIVTAPGPQTSTQTIDEDGYYYDKDNVALYLVTYHKLPGNYITKKEARKLGWEGGPLEPYAHDMAIGGDHFGNYEGTLPEDVEYHECDIDTKGKKRGAKRIIYSENWDIYYTDDHYETFTLLYEGE